MNKHGAIILCGGKSSRMGSSKALLPIGQEVMLPRIVRIVSEVIPLEHIVVVSAADQKLPTLPDEVTITQDARAERGPLEGLAAGLRTLTGKAETAFVTGCDVPLLKPEFISHMFALLADNDIVVPKEGKFHHPLAAVYRTSVLQQVQHLLDDDQLRPLFLFEKVKTREVPVEDLRIIDAELDSLLNCNNPDDYQQALRKVKGGMGDREPQH